MSRLLATTAIVVGALWFGAPVYAGTISITDNWSVVGTSHTSTGFLMPTLSTGSTSTSNDGTITPQGDNSPQTETIGTTGTNWLFAAIPGDTGTHTSFGDIELQLTLSDGSGATAGSVMFDVWMDYYANATGSGTDDMGWSSTAIASPGYLASDPSLVLNEVLSNGSRITVTLPYETDWDMAQAISYDVTAAPTAVPEPASMALLGVGLLGLGVVRRRG